MVRSYPSLNPKSAENKREAGPKEKKTANTGGKSEKEGAED